MNRPIAALTLGALLITSLGAARTPGGAPLNITAIIGLSGRYAILGEPERNAMQLAEQSVNRTGGINGRPLHIDILDDEGKPDVAVQLATDAVAHGSLAIICGNSNASSSAVARVTTAANVLQIFMTPAADIWDTPHGVVHNIFQTTPRNEVEIPALLDFAQGKLKMKRAAILYDENTYGSTGAQLLTAASKARNFSIVESQSYPGNASDFTPQLVKIRAADPDVVFLYGSASAPPLAVRNMRQLGMNVPIVGTVGIVSQNFLVVASKDGEGVYADTNLNLTYPDPVQRAFIYDYRRVYKAGAVNFSAFAYDAVALTAWALRASKGAGGEAAIAALEHMPPQTLTTGTFKFTTADHNGISTQDVHIVRDRNQVWETLR